MKPGLETGHHLSRIVLLPAAMPLVFAEYSERSPASAARNRSTADEWICETRDSTTPQRQPNLLHRQLFVVV